MQKKTAEKNMLFLSSDQKLQNLTLYDPIYFVGATDLGTFLLRSKLNNTRQVIEQNIIQIYDYTASNRIFTVYFHLEIKANLFGYNN